MRLWLVHAQAFHEPAILLRCQCSGFAFFPGPLKRTGLQTFIQQNKSVAFPVQCFYSIPPSTAEEEQSIRKRIQVKLLLDQHCQTVDPTAQIRITAGNIHPVGSSKVRQHDFRKRSTVSTVAASAPEWTSASAPEIRTVTATLPQVTGRTGVTSANETSCCAWAISNIRRCHL